MLLYPQRKNIRELKDILVEAKASFGENDQVIMLEALIRSKLAEHGATIENISTVASSPVLLDE